MFIYLNGINESCSENIIGIPVLNRNTRREKQIVGMFISTVPLGVKIDENSTVEKLFADISAEHSAIFRHQQYPYSDTLRFLREKHDFTGNLFDVMVSYQNAKINADCEFEYRTKWLHNGFGEIPLAIHIDDRDSSGSFTLNLDYQTAIFSEEHIALLFERLIFIIQQMISDEKALLGSIRIMPDSEYNKVVYEFNDTYSDYPRNKCVHELFAEQAKKNPDKTALIFEDTEFTYRQLDEMSNSLAHYLRERGVKPNDIVPIISKRSWHVIVAMLGVLKAGGAFTLLSPDYPSERIRYLISESSAKIVLIFGTAEKYCSTSLDLSKFDFSQETYEIDVNTSYDNFCCAIHTSGSTGNPKLTVLSHRSICNFAYNNVLMKKCDYYISLTTIVFDAFILDTIIPMMNSIPIIIASESETNNQQDFENLITKYKKCGCFATLTKMKSYFKNLINTSSLNNLHTLIIGGEVYDKDLFSTIKKYTNAQSINIYGPTEATINVSQKEFEIDSDEDITIGKPISNTQIYILNFQGKVCPIGVTGELCISGDGVGKGYLNRPELTAEKFVPNPFIAGKTMYKSGDLARWRVDGELEYLGRIDTQVKIRGLRIELGEIESVMAAFEGINMTAAADKKDASGRQYLVGYYTSEKEIDEKLLREFLSSKLPRYMIPNYFMRLDEIPMTSSGKTDRKNLPEPEITELATDFVAPVTATEKILCDAISKLFDGRKTGTSDNFFELGGDSLSAMQLVALLSEKGIIINMQDIYEYPTSAELGAFIDGNAEIHSEYKPEDFEKYNSILKPNSLNVAHELRYKPLGNILITGATGFLGAHLLNEAFIKESGKIYCLVRSEERLKKTLQYYFGQKYSLEVGNRIIPIIGDITDVNSSSLPTDVDTVIHSAANVKHYGNYSDFEKTNIIGTKNMLDYACSVKSRFIFISTASVGGMTLKRQGSSTKFSESDIYIGQNLDNVYIRSKFEAERLVLDRIQGGLIGRIFRMGNLTNRYSDGVFQPNYTDNAFLKRIKSFIDVRAIPNDLSKEYAEMTPVDKAAEAVILLAEYADNTQTVFHISNSRNAVTYEKLTELLCKAGINLTFIPTARFIDKIDATPNGESGFIMNELNELQRQSSEAKVTADSSYTSNVLSEIGFKWSDISEEYLKKYIEYFRSLNYFE